MPHQCCAVVLHRAPKIAIVWGFGAPGSTIKTDFNGASLTATTGTDGYWRQPLPATAAGGPYSLVFTPSTGEPAITLTDVLFGDVYICGGQSK